MVRPSVCILYGFCEGPHVAAQLMAATTAAGFQLTRDATAADIIFAHSGGCYLVPAKHQAQLIMLVGMSGTPGLANLRKAWLDLHTQHRAGTLWHFAVKTFWNGVYIWNMPQNWRMLRGWQHGTQRTLTNVIAIRNKDDMTTPAELSHFTFDHPPALISLSGQHDECWERPTPYVDIVRKYYYAT
jgi:hypothetical protein